MAGDSSEAPGPRAPACEGETELITAAPAAELVSGLRQAMEGAIGAILPAVDGTAGQGPRRRVRPPVPVDGPAAPGGIQVDHLERAVIAYLVACDGYLIGAQILDTAACHDWRRDGGTAGTMPAGHHLRAGDDRRAGAATAPG